VHGARDDGDGDVEEEEAQGDGEPEEEGDDPVLVVAVEDERGNPPSLKTMSVVVVGADLLTLATYR